MDEINIVGSQAVLKISFVSMDTRSMFSSPLSVASSKIDCPRPHQTSMTAVSNHPHYMNLTVVDTMLHDSTDLIIHRTEIWAVWRPQVGPKKVRRFLMQKSKVLSCCTCGAVCRCTVLLEAKVVTRQSAYRWHQYDVIMTS